MSFTKNTFRYLDLAFKEGKQKNWFENHEALYVENVRKPMGEIVVKFWESFSDELPDIKMDPKKISRPMKMKNKLGPGENPVRHSSWFLLSEKETSRFEWNPGIYFQISAEKEETVLGVGLYKVSGRQMKRMRSGIVEDFKAFDKIMNSKELKKRWKGLSGEIYTRFPKDYDEEAPYAKYLRHKSFYLSKSYIRAEILKKDFHNELIKDLKAALPFFLWVRNTIGTFERR